MEPEKIVATGDNNIIFTSKISAYCSNEPWEITWLRHLHNLFIIGQLLAVNHFKNPNSALLSQIMTTTACILLFLFALIFA